MDNGAFFKRNPPGPPEDRRELRDQLLQWRDELRALLDAGDYQGIMDWLRRLQELLSSWFNQQGGLPGGDQNFFPLANQWANWYFWNYGLPNAFRNAPSVPTGPEPFGGLGFGQGGGFNFFGNLFGQGGPYSPWQIWAHRMAQQFPQFGDWYRRFQEFWWRRRQPTGAFKQGTGLGTTLGGLLT